MARQSRFAFRVLLFYTSWRRNIINQIYLRTGKHTVCSFELAPVCVESGCWSSVGVHSKIAGISIRLINNTIQFTSEPDWSECHTIRHNRHLRMCSGLRFFSLREEIKQHRLIHLDEVWTKLCNWILLQPHCNCGRSRIYSLPTYFDGYALVFTLTADHLSLGMDRRPVIDRGQTKANGKSIHERILVYSQHHHVFSIICPHFRCRCCDVVCRLCDDSSIDIATYLVPARSSVKSWINIALCILSVVSFPTVRPGVKCVDCCLTAVSIGNRRKDELINHSTAVAVGGSAVTLSGLIRGLMRLTFMAVRDPPGWSVTRHRLPQSIRGRFLRLFYRRQSIVVTMYFVHIYAI